MKKLKYSWEKLDSQVIHSSPYVTLRKDVVRTDKNKLIDDYYIVNFGLGAVGVLLQNEGEEFLLVKHYRYSLDEVYWEIPAGRIDTGEVALDAAHRELLEETGYEGSAVEYLGFDYPAIGNSDLKYQYFLMKKLGKVSELLDEEIIELKWFTLREVFELIEMGKIVSGLCISAFFFYHLKMTRSNDMKI